MAAALLEPIRTGKTASVPSTSDETRSSVREKVLKSKAKETVDPLRVLEPARKKLTSLESQRIMAVLDDSIRRVEISTILPFIVENLGRFSIILGAELAHCLKEHDGLQSRYQKAVAQFHLEEKRLASLQEKYGQQKKQTETGFFFDDDDAQTSLESRSKTPGGDVLNESNIATAKEEVHRDFKAVTFLEGQLRQSLKSILRLFARNPSAFDTLRSESKERSEQANVLLVQLKALKLTLFERLLRTPLELKERNDYVAVITEKEVKYGKQAKKLQEELNAAVADKEDELSKRNDVIRQLRFDIFNVDRASRENNQQVLNEATKEQMAEEKNSEGKKSKLLQEIMEQKKVLEENITKHRESELALRKKKYKVETEVENWIQKYDSDMGERQDQFDELDGIYTGEKKQLAELVERFRTMEKEYNAIMEERRIAREKAEEANRELQMKIKAATLIQSFWRAFKARKQLKKAKKKKGKKGKKGAKKTPR